MKTNDQVVSKSALPELKVVDNKISGYAAIWNSADKSGDTWRRGCFSKTINERVKSGKVLLRAVHVTKDDNILKNIGVITKANEDGKGLWIESELFDECPEAKIVHSMVRKAPNAFGLSTTTRPLKKSRNKNGGIEFLESILQEITVTDIPADDATLGLKAASDNSLRDLATEGAISRARLMRELVIKEFSK